MSDLRCPSCRSSYIRRLTVGAPHREATDADLEGAAAGDGRLLFCGRCGEEPSDPRMFLPWS